MTVEIRRRGWLVATIAVLAGVFAAGYLWRFAVAGGSVLLGVGLVLGAIAIWYAAAWWRARTPLLVADATGVRVRLGSAWTGVRWDETDRVEVTSRGRVTDGRLLLLPTDEPAALSAATRRSRMEASWNRKVYGAALAVPYGLATTVSVDDLPGRLRLLADNRCEVVVSDQAKPQRQPTVEIGSPDAVGGSDAQVSSEPDEAPAPAVALTSHPSADGGDFAVSAQPLVTLPVRRLASAGGPQPARREDVTIAMRREATDGTLALSAATDEVHTEELPEISELRRSAPAADSDDTTAGGNVSLIIDATTDLSARAMSKVRRLAPEYVEPVDADPEAEAHEEQELGHPLNLGAELRRARENLRLSIDDLADRTRIRPFVIECMEADDFSPCGGDFYARGHLRMLARVLGVASEPLLETYDERFATAPVKLRDVFDIELASSATGMVRGNASGANWGGLVAAVVILVLIWGVARFFADDTATPAPPTSTSNSGSARFLPLHSAVWE